MSSVPAGPLLSIFTHCRLAPVPTRRWHFPFMSAVTRSGRLCSRLGANSLGGGGVDLDFLFEILFLARGHHLLSCRLSPVPVWASPAGFPCGLLERQCSSGSWSCPFSVGCLWMFIPVLISFHPFVSDSISF